ncbi:hypothetical protein V499_02353 [Pseudogymnoascus sp. VKM F-103]|nr:hypothetical protein V499_02353 [Pseudogymnoascus sp. VKM F-103]
MSASSSGLTLRPGNNVRVKSESDIDPEAYFDPETNVDGFMEDTPEASVGEDTRSDVEETEEEKKLRKKREYNRVAQREFRRRRKDRMTKLEQTQSVTVTEQNNEIFHLRRQNQDLRAQNEMLRAQVFASGSGWHPNEGMAGPPTVPSSLSPSRRHKASIDSSASSILESMTSDGSMMEVLGTPNILPANQLAMTSSMLPSAMNAFAGTMPSSGNMQGMQYPTGYPAGSRAGPQDNSGAYDFSSVAAGTSTFQTMGSMPYTISSQSQVRTQLSHPNQQASSSRSMADQSNPIAMMAANRIKISAAINNLFSLLIQEAPSFPPPASNQPCPRHLQILSAISTSLPAPFRPTPTQLTTAHYYGVDMIPSPTLRDRLCRVGPDVSAAFLHDFDFLVLAPNADIQHRLIIWGEEPFNEFSWEFSREIIARWGWLVGQPWAERANFWRTQRGLAPLPMPVEAPEGNLWGMSQQLRLGALGGESMVGSAVVGMAGLGLHPHNQHHMQ